MPPRRPREEALDLAGLVPGSRKEPLVLAERHFWGGGRDERFSVDVGLCLLLSLFANIADSH